MSLRPNRRWLEVAAAMAAIVAVSGCADAQQADQRDMTGSCPAQATATLSLIAPVAMPANPLTLDDARVSLRLMAAEDRSTAQRLAAVAQSEAESVVLQLRCVEAERPPGAIWEVYVGLPAHAEPNAEGPHFVGTVALIGDGIRSESNNSPFAEFVFVLDRAIAASSDASQMSVTFVPSSGVLVDGQSTPPDVRAPIRIGELNLLRDRAQPTP